MAHITRPFHRTALALLFITAGAHAQSADSLAPVTVTGKSPVPASVAGWGDVPLSRAPVAATSVGYLDDDLALDLVYLEDSRAEVDLNLVATRSGQIVEIQGTAEGAPIPRKDVMRMMDLALVGIEQLTHIQERALAGAGVELAKLLIPAGSKA